MQRTELLVFVRSQFGETNGLLIAVALSAALILAWSLLKASNVSAGCKKLPPGPVALPVVGSLHLLGKLPHRGLAQLARKYGPVMFLRMGSVPSLIFSSPEMAKLVLKTHDQTFATRPALSFGRNVLYGSKSLGFSFYGTYWKQIRKVVSSQLLGPKSLDSLKYMREEEMQDMVDVIMEHCNGSAASSPVNVSKLAMDVTMYMSSRMTLGRKYSEDELISSSTGGSRFNLNQMVKEFFYLAGVFNISDFIPWLQWLDVQGLYHRQKKLHLMIDGFLEKILEEHLSAMTTGQSIRDFTVDLAELLLDRGNAEEKFTRGEVKANMLEMLVAAIDTSSVTVEWAMSELLSNDPLIMNKVQAELERVVGLKNKYVQESALGDLEFLRAVVKETLRLHPPVPLMIPRENIEECEIGGYHIPRGCRVTVNVWAVSRDRNAWGDDADVFRPERFMEMDADVDVRGHHFQILPFGAGRRVCPGMPLAFKVVPLMLANLLHSFNWSLPDGMEANDLDMEEEFGLSTPRAVPLRAVPTLRVLS